MRPGPDRVVACPCCKGLATYPTLMSGNTLGARAWTDGKRRYPMLPSPPDVVTCRHCRTCYWLARARVLGTNEGRRVNRRWSAAEQVKEPEEEEYYAAIEKGLASKPGPEWIPRFLAWLRGMDHYGAIENGLAGNPNQEITLRTLAWWRGNDPYRKTSREPTEHPGPAAGARRRNLEALARLLSDADEKDRILKAEIFRELGEFVSAMDVLTTITSSEYDFVVRQLIRLCERWDTCVRELVMDRPKAGDPVPAVREDPRGTPDASPAWPRAYLVPGRGEPLDGPVCSALHAAGVKVEGREWATLAGMRFGEQLAAIQGDIHPGWWDERALLVGESYGGYLLMHTLAGLPAFPGRVVLLSPVLGVGQSADGWYASRPPRAGKLREMVERGAFPAPRVLEVHMGSEDAGGDVWELERLVSGIAGARCQIVPGAPHRLPSSYLTSVFESS
jgi:hypothetical protein